LAIDKPLPCDLDIWLFYYYY